IEWIGVYRGGRAQYVAPGFPFEDLDHVGSVVCIEADLIVDDVPLCSVKSFGHRGLAGAIQFQATDVIGEGNICFSPRSHRDVMTLTGEHMHQPLAYKSSSAQYEYFHDLCHSPGIGDCDCLEMGVLTGAALYFC